MKREELDVFSTASNAAIIRPPGRQFPGVVVQGDSLSNLYASAIAALTSLRAGDLSDCDEEIIDLCDQLRWRLELYEQVLTAEGIRLPYVPSVATDLKNRVHPWPPSDVD